MINTQALLYFFLLSMKNLSQEYNVIFRELIKMSFKTSIVYVYWKNVLSQFLSRHVPFENNGISM